MVPATWFFSYFSSASHRVQLILKIESAKEKKKKKELEPWDDFASKQFNKFSWLDIWTLLKG